MIKKILIANRGEIAVRIMRSAKEMGIRTVAVYSGADRKSVHTRYADEAVYIGEAKSELSYLNQDKIIDAAIQSGADAIHPGYGFLSENASFAKKVEVAGIIFVGPSPEAIEIMGDKLAAKQAVTKYNIPLVPGIDKAIKDLDELKRVVKSIGLPVLIKAAAGGGGKGMRIVSNDNELKEQFSMAISEAKAAFGDGSVFVEKYVTSPRHIEVQILADNYGHTLYLFERECSIQRRHQKVIEEAPSCILTPELRTKMGQSAVGVAKACNYRGAGTVEFIMDDQLNYYFLEMNTRLQVEHPVTEMITGIDLVKEQIKIASGAKLDIKQEELAINGHAIELRVYAEDPENNFLPDIGKLEVYKIPEGPGVRVDAGYMEGEDIPIFYDPLISKLIVHSASREEAIKRMARAIEEYKIVGVQSTLKFGQFVMNHQAFISGDFDTNFVNKYYHNNDKKDGHTDLQIIAAIAVGTFWIQKKDPQIKEGYSSLTKSWKNRLTN